MLRLLMKHSFENSFCFIAAVITAVFGISFNFSLEVSPSSSLMLSLRLFVLFVLRISSIFKALVCFASEVVVNISCLDQMLPAQELFYNDKNEASKLSDLSLVSLALASLKTFGTRTFRLGH